MRRVRYAVAASLDGFIAGRNGEYDWIEMDPAETASFFKGFFAQFEIAVMGRKSFEQYGGAVEGMETYVFSRTLPPGPYKDVTVVGEDGIRVLAELRAAEGDGRDIWLFGGGILFESLVAAGLVDRVEVSIMPIILGEGLPLMTGGRRVRLKLETTDDSLTGIVTLKYAVEH